MNLIFCDLPMSISNHSPNMLYKDTPLCVQPPLYQQIVSSVLWKRHCAFPVKEFSEVTCNYCLLIFWNLISMLRIICVRCQETIFTTDLWSQDIPVSPRKHDQNLNVTKRLFSLRSGLSGLWSEYIQTILSHLCWVVPIKSVARLWQILLLLWIPVSQPVQGRIMIHGLKSC